MQTIREVKDFIDRSEQLRGYVRLELGQASARDFDSPQRSADDLIVQLGFSPIGNMGWKVLSAEKATDLARKMLHKAMAYHQELLPAKTAEHIAGALVGGLSRYKSRFVANGCIEEGSAQWDSIGTSTFEMAVVGFDDTQAFLLYAEDED
jgi:hypothetical protein